MNQLAIGLGVGLVSVVTIVILGFILNYRLVRSSDADDEARQQAEDEAKRAGEINVQLEKNATALKSEITDLRNTNVMLVARLGAAEKVADDLLDAIQKNPQPGALPAALRSQLDRLRSHVSLPTEAATPGDSPGREDGGVHETPSIKPP